MPPDVIAARSASRGRAEAYPWHTGGPQPQERNTVLRQQHLQGAFLTIIGVAGLFSQVSFVLHRSAAVHAGAGGVP